LYKSNQLITVQNCRWIEEIIRMGEELASFTVSERVDNPIQKDPRVEEMDSVLVEIANKAVEVFAVASVAATAFLDATPIADKLGALVVMSGTMVSDLNVMRKRRLYGNAASAVGPHPLTPETLDANLAYKSAHPSFSQSSFYSNNQETNSATIFRKKRAKLGLNNTFTSGTGTAAVTGFGQLGRIGSGGGFGSTAGGFYNSGGFGVGGGKGGGGGGGVKGGGRTVGLGSGSSSSSSSVGGFGFGGGGGGGFFRKKF
jgi:hypothetical protein